LVCLLQLPDGHGVADDAAHATKEKPMTKLSKMFPPALLMLIASACGPSSGDKDPVIDGSSVTSTSDAGDASSQTASAFVGTWTYTAGSAVIQCGTAAMETDTPDGFLQISLGSSPNQLSVNDTGCAMPFTLDGTMATTPPGPSCDDSTLDSYTLTLQADGTLHEQSSGSAVVSGESCLVTYDAILVRS
jgi:hypothetical protein